MGQADFYFGYLNRDFNRHCHDCFEFHYVLKGNGFFRQAGVDIPFQPDTFHISRPGEEHALIIEGELTFYYIHYRPDGGDLPFLLGLESHYAVPRESRHDFSRMRLLLGEEGPAGKAGEHLLLSFLYSLTAGTHSSRFQQKPLIQAHEYMMENLSHKITLQELADHVHLEKHYFCRLFKVGAHMSPLAYFERLKMDAACSMIDQGVRGYLIAEYLGFCDETYFSRRFSRIVGMSPGEYRKNGRRH